MPSRLSGACFFIPPPHPGGKLHRDPRRFQVLAGGFTTDVGNLLDRRSDHPGPSQS